MDILLKTSRPGKHKSPISMNNFLEQKHCVASHLKRWGNEEHLFISLQKSHVHVATDDVLNVLCSL